jgi:cytochrome c553
VGHCNLNDYSPALRRELALRCAGELDSSGVPDLAAHITDSAAAQRLNHNATLLVEAYVHELAAQYAALPFDQRTAFIDMQLAQIEQWRVAELLQKTHANKDSSSTHLAAHMQAWVDHAPDQQRAQVAAFVLAVQTRLLWKQLPPWMRGRS